VLYTLITPAVYTNFVSRCYWSSRSNLQKLATFIRKQDILVLKTLEFCNMDRGKCCKTVLPILREPCS